MASPATTPVAHAQLATEDIGADAARVLDEILTQLVRAATVALFNAAQTFLGQLAYDAANYIATGGHGQQPLTQAKSPGDYFAQVGQDALGSAIGSLSQNFFQSSLGFDLCRPPDPRNLLNLQVSLGGLVPGRNGAFNRPRPSCDFQQVVHNYNQFFTTLSSTDLLQHLNANFNSNSSELGASLQIFGRSVGKVSVDVQKAAQDRGESGAFKSVTDVISGNVKTPAVLVAQQTQEQLVTGPNRDQGAARNAILSSAAQQGPIQLVTYTASMFINTLGSKLMTRILQKGLVGAFDFSDLDQQTAVASANPDALPARSRTDARKANLDLKDVSLIRVSNVEILSELIACPDVRGTWNCTMDQQLAQAISANACDNGSCTIASALDKGFLKGDWKLYPDSLVRQNEDKNCYQSAYCAGNLRKLRLMRILPVGFEFAANDDANIQRCASAGGCVTLKEVVDGFSNCNEQGSRDVDHPWCKIIDPNWTLTSFPQQCRLTGFGDTVVSARLGQRAEECQDIQTCLQRNDKGECIGGYGYCVAEKTVYRFKADECPAQDASCRVFATAAGNQVSYLRNTLDYGTCSQDNAGCLGYATTRVPDGASWVSNPATFTYFDSTLKPCSAQDDGCTKLLAAEVGGSALNLLANPSFELLTSAGVLQNWTTVPVGTYTAGTSATGRTTHDGSLSLELSSNTPQYFQRVQVGAGRVMTMSLYARAQDTLNPPSFFMIARQFNAGGDSIPAAVINTLFKSPNCIATITDPALGLGPSDVLGTDWVRYTCSFLTSNTTAAVQISMHGKHVLVDAAELEDGQFASPFLAGVNNALPVVHMKVAPDELACTGAATDPAVCGKFATSCRQVDAGCQGYKDNQGSPEVPAILSSNDLCPSACVGYAEYRKQPSSFDLVTDPDLRFSDATDTGKAYFIPATAKACKVSDVGCETFTNLEAAAAGGESSPSYSYLRLCEKPDANTQTYFTWEGSESAGYQLRTWSLVSAGGASTGPKIVTRRGSDGNFKDPASCNEALWRTGIDPDCRQFYDRTGNVFYTYESQTVLSSDACTTLRLGRRSNIDDCSKTGGYFDGPTGQCTYHALGAQSLSCEAPVAGCRGYAGAGAGNVSVVVNENFRAGRGNFSAGAPSAESLLVGDQSLRLQSGLGSALSTAVPFASRPSDLFRVSFWAKGAGTGLSIHLQLRDASNPASTPVDVGTAQLSGDWQRFSFGLFNGYTGASTSSLVFSLAGGASPIGFIDEVRVENVHDMTYVVANSWNTPDQCDRTFAGIPEPQAMLGCREYTDRFSNKVTADRFTSLCSEKAIGCRAFVDTRNSDSPASQTFVQQDIPPVSIYTIASGTTPVAGDFYPAATTTRPADKMLYLIYDTSKLCQAESDSCRAFGKPKYAIDRNSIESFDTVYFKDDITTYGQALCKPSEQFCSEFTYNGAKDYFKDPGDKACEYKENIHLSFLDFIDNPDPTVSTTLGALAEGTYSGWFRQGGNVPCYPANLQSGNFFGLPKRGDEPYTGWVGTCDPQYGECTEFRDPNDTTDPDHRTGKPYFFINNSKIDQGTCAGNYDQGAGCILLSDTNNPLVTYSTLATDLSYRQNNYHPVPPVKCAPDSTDPFCAGRCTGKKITQTGLTHTEEDYVGLPCETDSQCVIPASGFVSYNLKCVTPHNDSNVLVKVNTDRDCSQWLGCQSAETVFDTATNQYKDVCTNLALCDKTSGQPNDLFCGHYVDRSQQNTEPVLYQGSYFDANAYASRAVGLGQRDYDGYAVPNSFQIPDTQMSRVGVDGALSVKDNQNTFARDYRLVAVAHIPINVSVTPHTVFTARETPPNEAFVLDPTGPSASTIAAANPGLKLCQQAGSNIIGYYIATERATALSTGKFFFNCYLPLRKESDSYNFQNLVSAFTLPDPRTDPTLSKAFPEPECRSNPEADSPYAANFVTAWDFSKNPPVPTAKLSGFENAHTCEYGEDCSCSYKRAEYETPSLTKFFGPLSSAVPPGICQGGPRNGEACLPSAVLQTSGGSSAAVDQGLQAANAQQLCGDPNQGGRCVATSKIQVIRGIFGQCLERDTTRILGGDRTQQPCLTWDPNPILFGDKDPFHYQPTSGYLPPQNSGQYYCVSPAKAPQVLTLGFQQFRRYNGASRAKNPSSIAESQNNWGHTPAHPETTDADGRTDNIDFDWRGAFDRQFYPNDHSYPDSGATYVGKMSKPFYDKDWLGPDNRCEPNCTFSSASIDGFNNNYGTTYANACEASDDFEGGDGIYENAIRLVDAGNGYRETFYSMNTPELMRSLGGRVTPIGPAAAPTDAYVYQDDIDSLFSDNSIGYFQLSPMNVPQRAHFLGCGYQADWAENVPAVDYANEDSVKSGDHVWKDAFNRDFTGFLTRSGETVLASGGHPLQGPCADDGTLVNGAATSGPDGLGISRNCYFKTWQTGYHDQGKQEFDGIFTDTGDTQIGRSLLEIRQHPIKGVCNGTPYFSVRAVFQTPVERTAAGASVADPQTITTNGVQGPWRFIGFWVSSCAGNAPDDQRYIYFNIKLGTADVCRQLAEVQSSGSRQDAAFTDRIWSQGGFREQNVGTTYGDAASPFSSAINTRSAGAEPLFQTGQELAGFSPLHPPTFLRSGITTYYANAKYPRDKWAYLTNLFARIYRVYQFHYAPVPRGGTACTQGPFKGTACSITGNDPICSVSGVCKKSEVSQADLSTVNVCNRGPEAGIQCQNDTDCKAATFRNNSDTLTALLTGCGMASGWTSSNPTDLTTSTARFTDHVGTGGSNRTRRQASAANAFACASDGIHAGVPGSCTIPTANGSNLGRSTECPVALSGTCGTSANICQWDRATYHTAFDSANLDYNHDSGPITTVNNRSYKCGGGVASPDCSFTAADFDTNAACGPAKDEVSQTDITPKVGRCSGGLRGGQLCVTTADNSPNDADSCVVTYGSTDFTSSCGPVDNGSPNFFPSPNCLISGAPTSTDPDFDNNACTNSGGYQPRPDLCPNPNDEYCGLIAYKINDTASYSAGPPPVGSLDPASPYPLPTDVTLGHYTPTFLGFPSTFAINASTFSYITYYTPRPPQLAAPDTRNCAVPGQCPISHLGSFAFDNQTDGAIVAGGGQHKANLRFYAWASHNQMPLRQVTIDWGDGKVQSVDDTKLKNRKPFCGVQKECSLAPGLTCQTDTDCPPASGRCVPVGVCANSPQRSCNADADCTVNGVADTCRIRTLFGNSTDACQQDYFDFTHVYTCGTAEQQSLTPCDAAAAIPAIPAGQCYFGRANDDYFLTNYFGGTRLTCTPGPTGLSDCQTAYYASTARDRGGPDLISLGYGSYTDASCGPPAASTALSGRCSRDPARPCGPTAACAVGDSCVTNLAPPAGCFDTLSNSCRFTPRVIVQDNWGWCTGECRNTLSGGALVDGPDPVTRVRPNVLHPYGGCYTGNVYGGSATEKVRFNTKASTLDTGGDPSSLYVTGKLIGDTPFGECNPNNPPNSTNRPWIVYPGALELRRNSEIAP
jgi:hypothetical protein